jgi:hypothetical protein
VNVREVLWALSATLLVPAALEAQQSCPVVPGSVVVYGEGTKTTTFDPAGLAAMARRQVTGPNHDGDGTSVFSGVALKDLLVRAGAIDAERLTSRDYRRWVEIQAADGYRVVYALTELEPDFRPAVPILADRQNGEPLPADVGPFQVVMPDEKRHGRWVRQVTCLRVGIVE